MRASQDSITRILRRFGEHDLSIGIVSPVALYDVWLSRAGLSIDSLDQSSLDLLGSQLVRLGELVGDPATAVPGELWESSGLESHREGAVAMLNERLKIAQERYSMLVTATDSSSISTGPEMPRHADAGSELHKGLLRVEAALLELRNRDLAVEPPCAKHERHDADPLQGVEIMERRWALWGRVLSREYVATIIGGFLLVGLAVALVSAMFLNEPVTDIISNSFLIILGYFFGHNAISRPARTGARSSTS